jgi:hypothetical protein
VIETLAVNGVTDGWRRGRLPALHAIVPQAGKILQPEQKKKLQELARACADVKNDAAVREGLQKFAAAIGGWARAADADADLARLTPAAPA